MCEQAVKDGFASKSLFIVRKNLTSIESLYHVENSYSQGNNILQIIAYSDMNYYFLIRKYTCAKKIKASKHKHAFTKIKY